MGIKIIEGNKGTIALIILALVVLQFASCSSDNSSQTTSGSPSRSVGNFLAFSLSSQLFDIQKNSHFRNKLVGSLPASGLGKLMCLLLLIILSTILGYQCSDLELET